MGEIMKKVLSILLCIIVAFCCFTACSKSNSKDTEKTTVKEMEMVSEIPQERIAHKSIEPAPSFAGGDGSKESPFEISNAAELQYFANVFNNIQLTGDEDVFDWQQKYQNAYYVLTEDITVNSDAEMKEADTKAPTYNWQPIGKFSDDKNQDRMSFQGSFDGREHYVSGLYSCVLGEVTGADAYLGLFADATKATISNVTVKNSYFYAYNSTGGAAALAGRLYESSIENCHAENVRVYAHSGSVAGVVGNPISTNNIVGCTASGQIKSGYSSNVGGLTASLSGGLIKNCINNAEVIGFENAISGGIASLITDSNYRYDKGDKNDTVQIIGCVNNGTIKSESFGAAGICARTSSGKGKIIFSDCKNTGKITAVQEVGGIIGSQCAEKGSIYNKEKRVGTFVVKNCENVGEISGNNMLSGIIGHSVSKDGASTTIKDCTNTGTIEGSVVGGIVGTGMIEKNSKTLIENCKNNSNLVCTESFAGGIIALYTTIAKDKCDGYEFRISNCTNDGLISNKGSKGALIDNACIGGILGKKLSTGCSNDSFIIDSCSSKCDFKCENDSYVGGIAGYLLATTNELNEIKNCSASGNIDFTVNEYEPDETSKELEGKIVNYVGGIAGTAQDTVIFKNCKSDINFKVVSGEKAKVRYDDACPMIVK